MPVASHCAPIRPRGPSSCYSAQSVLYTLHQRSCLHVAVPLYRSPLTIRCSPPLLLSPFSGKVFLVICSREACQPCPTSSARCDVVLCQESGHASLPKCPTADPTCPLYLRSFGIYNHTSLHHDQTHKSRTHTYTKGLIHSVSPWLCDWTSQYT